MSDTPDTDLHRFVDRHTAEQLLTIAERCELLGDAYTSQAVRVLVKHFGPPVPCPAEYDLPSDFVITDGGMYMLARCQEVGMGEHFEHWAASADGRARIAWVDEGRRFGQLQ